MAQELSERAKETIRAVFGFSIDTGAGPDEPESAADLKAIFVEHAFGDSWSRDALDARTRSLVTVAVLTALGAERELRSHVGGALSLGVSPDELVDLFIHLGVYAGVPRANAGWAVASDVVASRKRRSAPEG